MTSAENPAPPIGDGEIRVDREWLRLLASLAKQRAWVDTLTPEIRAKIVARLCSESDKATSVRDMTSVVKALAALETNDINRARLLLEAKKAQGGSDDVEPDARFE